MHTEVEQIDFIPSANLGNLRSTRRYATRDSRSVPRLVGLFRIPTNVQWEGHVLCLHRTFNEVEAGIYLEFECDMFKVL